MYTIPMIEVRDSTINQIRLKRITEAWRQLLTETLKHGFHGTVGLEVHINDGVIQHYRRKVERLEK